MHNERIGEKIETLPSENVFDDFERNDGNENRGEILGGAEEIAVDNSQTFVQPILPDGRLSENIDTKQASRADIVFDEKDIAGSVNQVCETYGDNPFLLANEINKISRELNSRNG